MSQSPWRVPLFWVVVGLPLGCIVALAVLIWQANRVPAEAPPTDARRSGIFTLRSP